MKIKMRKFCLKLLKYSPLILGFITLAIVSSILLNDFFNKREFTDSTASIRTDIITISGILSGIIIAYLTSKVLQIRSERIARTPEIVELTQKLHKFRAIVNKILHSNLWPNNLRSTLNYDYKGLTYFDVREIAFVGSKSTEQANKFIRDENYGGIARLILELKSFMFEEIPFDETLYSEFEIPLYYNSKILEKWIRYDCGNGLWYYFENKYSLYKENLNLCNVYSGYQEEIVDYARQIDRERYKDDKFTPELLAKLGTQIHSDIIPNLYRKQVTIEKGLPLIINYLFAILSLLILFGVALPIIIKIFTLSYIFDIISISVILSICVFIVTSFYDFLKDEIRI